MRRSDWKARLRETIAAAAAEPFRYGVCDCALFAARGVEAVTGIDHAARFGDYLGPRAARRIAGMHGGLEALATAVLGAPVAPHLVRAGDVVLAELETGATLGLCEGDICAFKGRTQIVRRRRDVIRLGWRVD